MTARNLFPAIMARALLIGLSLLVPLYAWASQTNLVGRTVDVQLVHADTFSLVSDVGDLGIETKKVILTGDDRIPILLRDGGIRPDIEALTLVFDLNPKMRKLDDFVGGDQIVLPCLISSPSVREDLAHDCVAILTVDGQLKQMIASNAVVIQTMTGAIDKIPVAIFGDLATKKTVVTQVADLSDWFGHIRTTFLQRRGRCLNRETLVMLNDEGLLLKTLLTKLTQAKQPLTPFNLRQVEGIHHDLAREIEKYDDVMSANPTEADLDCAVIVTLIGHSKVDVDKVRVYYLPDWDFRTPLDSDPPSPHIFKDLGLHASGRVLAKDYIFWASEDGDFRHFLTAPTPFAVRPDPTGKPLELTLYLR